MTTDFLRRQNSVKYCYKLVSQVVVIILGQDGSKKENKSIPKTGTDEFVSAKQSLWTWKRICLHLKQGQNSCRVSFILSQDQEREMVMKSTKSSWRTVKNTKELEDPNTDLISRKKGTYRCRVATEVCCSFFGSNQVDAAAWVGEDKICGGGGGAQAAEKQREEEDDRRGRMEKT